MYPDCFAPSPRWPTQWRLARYLAPVAIILGLTACAGAPRRSVVTYAEPTYQPSHATPPANLPVHAPANSAGDANDVLFRAMALVGTPYRWGGNTPDSGFDCSGLVDYIYRNATGLVLPRNSRQISAIHGRQIRHMTDLASGDLVFFVTGRRGISHVGVYVGNGRFVHAPNTGGVVRLDDIDLPYWRRHFAFGKRVLG